MASLFARANSNEVCSLTLVRGDAWRGYLIREKGWGKSWKMVHARWTEIWTSWAKSEGKFRSATSWFYKCRISDLTSWKVHQMKSQTWTSRWKKWQFKRWNSGGEYSKSFLKARCYYFTCIFFCPVRYSLVISFTWSSRFSRTCDDGASWMDGAKWTIVLNYKCSPQANIPLPLPFPPRALYILGDARKFRACIF